ncbi:hypothetical protein A6395_04570 [Exiguobacterium sp. SH31]|uniref:hypothetical protein n=1 Tax=unclassified Exiguobacterium TaxID=2644629 RepID=UPI0008AF5366|nr:MULTISPECIES: hypothetical protein [unclassified Exiguobacterium]OGX79880.1 hypothetical protein A6395_04570 [Exiguobacterium sp. SH31]TCI73499.1 hypothetical protein EVJ22_03630 [Exiguobacterium sp. SH0S7]
MNGDRLTRLMGDVDDCFVEESMVVEVKKRRHWRWIGGLIAAAAVTLFAVTWDGFKELIPLSDSSSNMSVAYIDEEDIDVGMSSANLAEMSEDELFSKWDPIVVRGIVKQIDQIELDFNGQEEYQSIVTIGVTDVYRGDIGPGSTIQVLTVAGVGSKVLQSDADVISELRLGTEGIFMPRRHDASHIWSQNGAMLQVMDVSDYGFPDGDRYMFLETDEGLVFSRDAYPSLNGAETLDDVEAFMMERFR